VEVAFIESRASACYEYPGGDLAPAFAQGLLLALQQQGFEGVSELLTHIHTTAFTILGGTQSPVGKRAPDFDTAPVKVEVVPLEGQCFTKPEPCTRQERDEWVRGRKMLLAGPEQHPQFFTSECVGFLVVRAVLFVRPP